MILINLHVGLFKFIKREFPKLKTFTQRKNFVISISKAYVTELLRVYKQAFLNLDPLYRQQKKRYTEQMKLKANFQTALKMLKYIDAQMAKMGKNRQTRRAFWRDFFKDGDIRTDVFEQLEKEIK
jgi:carbamoylphosphate synthase large subunit